MKDNNMITILQKAFSYKGRINKREYALSLLKLIACAVIAFIVCSFLMYLLMTHLHSIRIWNSFDIVFNLILHTLAYVLPVICIIILSLYFFAQGAKRCHDIGLSGWHILIPFYFIALLFEDGNGFETQSEMSNLVPKSERMEETPHTDIPETVVMEEPYEWPIDNTGLFTNVFNLMGRISQLEFLLVVLIGFGVLLILPFLIIIWRLALLAESIKRLHDFGLSGYWCIPALIAAVVMLLFYEVAASWITDCCIAIFWLYVIILLLVPGTRGINEYGTNPLRSYREQTLEAGYPDI